LGKGLTQSAFLYKSWLSLALLDEVDFPAFDALGQSSTLASKDSKIGKALLRQCAKTCWLPWRRVATNNNLFPSLLPSKEQLPTTSHLAKLPPRFFPSPTHYSLTQPNHTSISSSHLFRPITTLRIPPSLLSNSSNFLSHKPRCTGTAVASYGSSSVSYLCSLSGELS